MNVIVIGGGPAGMMAAVSSARQKNKVILLEKMNTCGRKLLITGKGRCNITSSLSMDKFIENTPGNDKFLYSAFKNFTNKDILELLKQNGVEAKEERGNRMFPVSDKSMDVLNAFIKEMKKYNINVIEQADVRRILTKDNKVTGVRYIDKKNNEQKELFADKVILATGGKSYPNTGSTGDGYKMAKELGHTIKKVQGSLVPLTVKGYDLELCKRMQGLSLRNIGMQIEDITKNKVIYSDFGELLFTHFGVSGPTVLSSSAHLLRYKNIENLLREQKVVLKIDLKPALDMHKLNLRVLRDFEGNKNKQIIHAIDKLLPKKMIEPVLEKSKIKKDKKVNEITKLER